MIKYAKNKLKIVAKEYGLADIYIFGSQVKGCERPDSDLDIGVRFKKGLPPVSRRGKIYGNLFADIGMCFKREVDLIFIDEAPLHFQFNIVAEGKLIYSQNIEKTFNFKEMIINYYRDYKYFIDEYYNGVLAASNV